MVLLHKAYFLLRLRIQGISGSEQGKLGPLDRAAETDTVHLI